MPKLLLSRFSLPRTPATGPYELVNRATVLTFIGANGQTRKDKVTPQVMHPLAVQRLLSQAGIDDASIHAAALLHDSVEDNLGETGQWLRGEIETTLGKDVLFMVDALTDDAPKHLPRAQRKALQMARMAQASWAVKVIKLADVVASMNEGPAPSWTVQYAAEYVEQRTRLVTEVLQSSSATLAHGYQIALAQPVWQAAIHASTR